MRSAWGLALVVAFVLPAMLATAEEPAACNPEPIGRCGAYDREAVTFCYLLVAGKMVSATDSDAIILGGAALPQLPVQLPPLVANLNFAYVRAAPAVAFASDPWNAELPLKSIWKESNNAPGLQTKASTCATFLWFAECNSWMGPYAPRSTAADMLLA